MASNFTWTCCKKDESKRKYLEDLLPQEYQYQILEFDLIKDNELFCEAKFEAKLKTNVCSPQGLEVFLEKFKDISHTEWNKFKADSTDTKFFQQSGWRKCCHNVQKKVKIPQTGEMKSDKSKGKRLIDIGYWKWKILCFWLSTVKIQGKRDHSDSRSGCGDMQGGRNIYCCLSVKSRCLLQPLYEDRIL